MPLLLASRGQICPISHARLRLRRVAPSAMARRHLLRQHRQRQQQCHLILTLIIILTVHILQLQLQGRSSNSNSAVARCARYLATSHHRSNSRPVGAAPAPRRTLAVRQQAPLLQGRAQALVAAATRTLACVSVPCHQTDRCYAHLCVWRGRLMEEEAVVGLPLSQPGMSKCDPAQPVV